MNPPARTPDHRLPKLALFDHLACVGTVGWLIVSLSRGEPDHAPAVILSVKDGVEDPRKILAHGRKGQRLSVIGEEVKCIPARPSCAASAQRSAYERRAFDAFRYHAGMAREVRAERCISPIWYACVIERAVH